jgi:hypothetical protein
MDLKILVKNALTGSFCPARTVFATKNRLIRKNGGYGMEHRYARKSYGVLKNYLQFM